MRTLACTTPAIRAGPPGTIFPAAFPARWAVAAVPQAIVVYGPRRDAPGLRSASRVSHHIDAMLQTDQDDQHHEPPGLDVAQAREGPEQGEQSGSDDVEADGGQRRADRADAPAPYQT